MIIDDGKLDLVFKGFKAVYKDAYEATPIEQNRIAMEVPSSAANESYGWLGQFPGLRPWVGSRIIKSLSTHGFTIENEKFESTVNVKRDMIADDRIGVFKPMFADMGRVARQHPDTMLFALMQKGFAAECYDGQNFFDTDHPTFNEDGEEVSFSNMQDGAGPAWFLLDTSRQIRPFIWQIREGYEFTQITSPSSHYVFMNDEYLYGIRARVNAGYGLWQLAFGSKAPLTTENYEAARTAMMTVRGDEGALLGVKPNLLVVGPQLEGEARALLLADRQEGSSNVWKDSAELIVSPYAA